VDRPAGLFYTDVTLGGSPGASDGYTEKVMNLREARLCLDCEEIHEAAECPVCASESFAFVSRWLPLRDHRAVPRPATPPETETKETYRRLIVADAVRPKTTRLVKQGAVGLAVISLARWMWRQHRHAASNGKKEPVEVKKAAPQPPVHPA